MTSRLGSATPHRSTAAPRLSAVAAAFCAALLSLAAPLLAQPYTFTHLAGTLGGAGFEDASGAAARFYFPSSVAADGAGHVFVADTANHTIRMVDAATGTVTTLAGRAGQPGSNDGTGSDARFDQPYGVATDGAGNVFVADSNNNTIRRIVVATGAVTTLAGTAGQWGSADGIGAAALFGSPAALAFDGAGHLLVADTFNYTIRRIVVATADVTTVAGQVGVPGSADGTGAEATFNLAYGLTVDENGDVYVADTYNHTIRKVVVASGEVSTFAGLAETPGTADGSGIAAMFDLPYGVCSDGAGMLYVADSYNHTLRRIEVATAAVTTIAGQVGVAGSSDGVGSAASFYYPSAVASDGAGHLLVADTSNDAVRRVTTATVGVTTLAGLAGQAGSSDGVGAAAALAQPYGVAADGGGNVFVADSLNHTIRQIEVATGTVTTLAGLAGAAGSADGTGSEARFRQPSGVASDGAGTLYVADTENHTIRRIDVATGAVTTLAGLAGTPGSANGTGGDALFWAPTGVAADGAGNVFVADTNNHTVRRIAAATGEVTTLAGLAGQFGGADGDGADARFFQPTGVAADGAGDVFVADTSNATIRRIVVATGSVSTLAGQAQELGSEDGSGSLARFYYPGGVAADGAGNVYVADSFNFTVRKIEVATANVSTLGGLAGMQGCADGTGATARFFLPYGIAAEADGRVYVSDSGNNAIRSGAVALADVATIDAATGSVGESRQLDTAPQTATSWGWEVVVRPAGSTALLSSATVRNPTFTPDRPGLYTFRLNASDGVLTSLTRVDLDATGMATPGGDVNGDGSVNVSDVFYLINSLFAGGPAPVGPADVNGDATVNVADVFYLINYLFAGGPAPV